MVQKGSDMKGVSRVWHVIEDSLIIPVSDLRAYQTPPPPKTPKKLLITSFVILFFKNFIFKFKKINISLMLFF